MQSRVLQRLAVAAVLVVAAGASVVSTAAARPVLPGPKVRSSFSLFGGSPIIALQGNRINCGLTNFGNICVSSTGSPTIEGGFWPNGTADAFVFNGGLQIGGTVQYAAGTSPAPWQNDTVGVFFMDPRGPQRMGSAVDGLYNGLNSNDLAVWPSAAYIQDTSLYNAALVGQKTISQQDTWVRYWDGDLTVGSGRNHAMGVLVEQRGLAWNTVGQEDILYFLIRFINITATDPTAYAGLADAGYTPAQIADIVSIANAFHAKVLAQSNVNLPASGYTFHNTYAAFFQDPDLGFQNDHNYSSAILPFALTAVMKSNYYEQDWVYPANLYSPPFQAAPGYEGVKYLKSPVNPATGREFGITVWGNTSNGGQGGVADAVGIWQMYRYISGTNSPAAGDGPCNAKEPPAISHTCVAVQQYADTRFFESSGPFELGPGQSSVIVVAMIFAAPLAQWAATSNGIYAMPGGNLNTYVTQSDASYSPLWPAQPESLAQVGAKAPDGTAYVRDFFERPAGWGQFNDVNGDGILEQDEVQTPVAASLLGKAKTAQLIFDNKFLSPFAPAAPDFYLVPGDGQVSVVWKKSASETNGIGDPYYAVAGDPTSALYDPNYRQFDVEGYRVYRGRTKSQMQLIAQFDYQGTSIVDYTGNVYDPTNYTNIPAGGSDYQCAPELGITGTCPAFPFAEPLVGNVIQIRGGGRQALANGDVVITKADTAVTGGGSPFPTLKDNLVPFAFVDNAVRDGFTYFYAVTAFDVNSYVSGSSSLESSLVPKAVTPVAASGQETAGSLGTLQILGGDGTVLNPGAALPTIDAATGEFSGPMPPANGGNLGFLAFVPSVIASGAGAMTLTVDSVMGGDPFSGVGGQYYATVATPAGASKLVVPMPYELASPGTQDTVIFAFPAQPNNQAKASRFGGDTSYALYGSLTTSHSDDYTSGQYGRAFINGAAGIGGPRWWSGTANENTPNPNGETEACNVFANGVGCGRGTHMAGALTGVDSLFWADAYLTTNSSPMRYLQGHLAGVHRAADFNVYWGAAGVVDSVVDVSNHTHVPFRNHFDATWGILNDSSFLGIVDSTLTRDGKNSLLTWSDFFCVAPWPTLGGNDYGPANACGATAAPAVLMNHARLSPIAAYSSTYAATATQTATGNGFGFFLNGELFLMQMTALPTNVVWHMRDYVGVVSGDSAGANFAFSGRVRPIAVPGMQFKISYQGSVVTKTTSDSTFANIHTVPDPYYVTNSLEQSANNKILEFVNLPAQCIVRIYSASGVLVRVLTHNDPGNGSVLQWDLRNRNNQFVASGVYFYHVEAADGRTKVGRFTVVNFAQ